MGSFLDPFGGENVSVVSGGLSRPSRNRSRSRHHSRSRSRVSSHKHKKKRSHSRSRSSSRGRSHGLVGSVFNNVVGGDQKHHHDAKSSSLFGFGNTNNTGRFFGLSKPSYYKRSSRHGFLHRSYKHLKRLIRTLIHWTKRHPWKVFFLVIMPLVSGGILTALLARFGLRLPRSLERLVGIAGKAVGGDIGGAARDTARMATTKFRARPVAAPRSSISRVSKASRTSATIHVRDRGRGIDRTYRGTAMDGWGGAVSGMAKLII